MEFVTLSTLPGIIGRYLMMLKVTDILDIAIMVFVFYKALTLIQSTRAASLLKGVLVFLAALMLSMVLNMNSINFIMNQLVRWGVVALIVLFQPEIRRILEEVGSRRFIAFFSRAEAGTAVEQAIDQTVLACTEMSQSRTGALIVFERENLLDDMVRSGTVLDAAVSSELLKNIFFVKAPMHDGAVIVRNGRVLGAGCMLPLSKNVNLSRELGMRHRAGIGMSENADAVVHLGNYSRREFLAAYPASQQLHAVIPHHIYEGLYAPIDRGEARRKLGIPADAFVMLAFGAFRHASERKLVWRAFRRLPLAGKFLLAPRLWPYTLNGSYHRGVKRLAVKTLYHAAHAAENRFRMRITSAEGLIPDADLPAYFTAADVVFIQRTDILNSGNVPQAFAFGRVVAGPDSGNIGEMLAATGNPVFDPADPASVDRALAEAARLADAGHGGENLEYAREHLRLPQIAAAYGRIYQRLHDAQRR